MPGRRPPDRGREWLSLPTGIRKRGVLGHACRILLVQAARSTCYLVNLRTAANAIHLHRRDFRPGGVEARKCLSLRCCQCSRLVADREVAVDSTARQGPRSSEGIYHFDGRAKNIRSGRRIGLTTRLTFCFASWSRKGPDRDSRFRAISIYGGDSNLSAASLAPFLSITLVAAKSITVSGLLDTGATVSVLPYGVGEQLGPVWEQQTTAITLSGNLAACEARALVVSAVIGSFPSVRLVFAWAKTDAVPVLLGHVNFFLEFDVCFYRSRSVFEVRPKRPQFRSGRAVGNSPIPDHRLILLKGQPVKWPWTLRPDRWWSRDESGHGQGPFIQAVRHNDWTQAKTTRASSIVYLPRELVYFRVAKGVTMRPRRRPPDRGGP